MSISEKQRFKISIIDFIVENGKHEVGKDKLGNTVCLGDLVKYNNEDNWFIVYRYGNILLKQVGMIAMIGSIHFVSGDFSNVEKQNAFASGVDWLAIGYEDEPFYEKVKHLVK